MASNNASVGKWEVVKKGKKTSSTGGGKNSADKKPGGGERRALSESNLPSRRKWTRPAWRQLVAPWPVCHILLPKLKWRSGDAGVRTSHTVISREGRWVITVSWCDKLVSLAMLTPCYPCLTGPKLASGSSVVFFSRDLVQDFILRIQKPCTHFMKFLFSLYTRTELTKRTRLSEAG